MKRWVSLCLALIFSASMAHAEKMGLSKLQLDQVTNTRKLSGGDFRIVDPLTELHRVGGLTFYKDYASLPTGEVTARQLDADYALGSEAATFTAAYTGKTSSWIDDNGVINKHSGTDNLARVNGGYYDATGFHAYDSNSKRIKGLMVEAARTNYWLNTNFSLGTTLGTSWTQSSFGQTFSLIPATDVLSSGNWQRVQHTFAGTEGDYGSLLAQQVAGFSAGQVLTISFLIKGSTSITTGEVLKILARYTQTDGTYTGAEDIVSIANINYTSPVLITKTLAALPAATTKVEIRIGYWGASSTRPQAGDTADFYITRFQGEFSPYSTSFIPTTTASLSRPAETLSYLTSGNRTAATESIFVRFAPEWAGTDPTTSLGNKLSDTDTKSRSLANSVSTDDYVFYPNFTDSVGAIKKSGVVIAKNTSSVITGIAYSPTGNPNTGIKDLLGSLLTDDTDWTSPSWGTKFYIGCNNAGATQFDGIIQSSAIYSDAKSSTDVSSISTILASP